MSKCCGDKPISINNCDPCSPPVLVQDTLVPKSENTPAAWFDNMIDNCLEYAEQAKSHGRPIVGIMCEYAPRELIMAAGGIPICLCGGSARTISPAEEYLPANLCPLIKSTFGYLVTNTNPFLEMADMVVAETTCDGKKKMMELMAETKPVHIMELPQKQDDSDAFEHWVAELRKLKTELENRFGVDITDEKIREAIAVMNRERALRRSLAELMKTDNPPFTGRQLLDFKSTISGIPADLEQYEKAISLYGGETLTPAVDLPDHDVLLSREGRGGREALTPAVDPLDHGVLLSHEGKKGKVRVLLTGVPTVHGAERVVDIIEDSGGLIVCQENCTGLKPILEDVNIQVEDPIRALAHKYFRVHCAVMTRNTRRLDYIRELAREYRAQCVIDLIWQACAIYDIESYQVRRLAQQELHLPYLRIETDYSPSDSARIAVRVEALYETVRSTTGSLR